MSLSDKVQDVNDSMQRLVDLWDGLEQSVVDEANDHRRRSFHVVELQKDTLKSHCGINYSKRCYL